LYHSGAVFTNAVAFAIFHGFVPITALALESTTISPFIVPSSKLNENQLNGLPLVDISTFQSIVDHHLTVTLTPVYVEYLHTSNAKFQLHDGLADIVVPFIIIFQLLFHSV
jgi:hypothetical protein